MVSVGGESRDVTVRVGSRNRVEEKVKEPKDQGAGWFTAWMDTTENDSGVGVKRKIEPGIQVFKD